jgi:hypothetical protein
MDRIAHAAAAAKAADGTARVLQAIFDMLVLQDENDCFAQFAMS